MATTHRAALERPRFKDGKGKAELNYDDRYQTGYKRICAIAHRRTNQLCCVCLKRKSSEIHHAFYRQAGDVIGWNVFPCDSVCHDRICHSKANWIVDSVNPVWGNRNTDKFLEKLRQNYKLLASGIDWNTPRAASRLT